MTNVTVAGVDFTSAPTRKKPITVAVAIACMDSRTLDLQTCYPIFEWLAFESFLATPPAAVIALDLPLSLPRDFLEEVGWPTDWHSVMQRLAVMGKDEYERWIQDFCASQPVGQKHRFRPCDRLTRSSSPMKLAYPPVGKMLFQGATRLWGAQSLAVWPFRPLKDAVCVCVEGYPALVARCFNASTYKREGKPDTPVHREGRLQLVDALQSSACQQAYGFTCRIPDDLTATLVEEPSGDRLDAVLCAVQAAWAAVRPNYGIPETPDAQEGWIVDPSTHYAYAT